MPSEHLVWTIMLWGFGICATGFFLLAGWMWWLVGRIRIRDGLMDMVLEIKNSLKTIEGTLVGNFDKKGLITKVYELDERCERTHGPGTPR